jgi:hypothetical protein
MKKIYSFILFLIIFNTSFSQDYIYFFNGKKVGATVLEVTRRKISYREADDPADLVRTVSPHEVYMITYRTGKEEILGLRSKYRQEKFYSNGKNNYYGLSVGIGQSHGFFGMQFQCRWGSLQGWGYHGGIGVSPFGTPEHPATLNFSVGWKYYFYKGWFLGLQFGSFPVKKLEEVRPTDTSHMVHYNYNINENIRTAYGLTIMTGGDWMINRYFGFNGDLGVSINVTRPDYTGSAVAVDFGVIFRIPGIGK